MIKELLKKHMPKRQILVEHKALKIFGKLLHNPNLWHLNRCSVATAFSVGLFFAWIPVPFQMMLAAAAAILFNANLPISVALVWLTNPATMPPLFFFAYKLGSFILSTPPGKFKFQLSVEWLLNTVNDKWQPFLLGCIILAIASSLIGNITVRLLWRYFIIKTWKNRQAKRRIK